MTTGKLRISLLDHRGSVHRLAFSNDGKVLAVASYRFDETQRVFGEVKLWDPLTGKVIATIQETPGFIRNLQFSPNGKTLVLSQEKEFLGSAAELKLLALPSGRLLGTVSLKGSKDSPNCLALGPDGKILAAGNHDGSIRLWLISPPQ